MGRPREFDEDVAVDKAMDVFWRQGYEGTSTEELMEAMGIGRGSFYHTFGSKREVYLRTLDRYLLLLSEGGPYRALFEEEAGAAALEALIDGYLRSVSGDRGAHGCYFVHAAKEHRGRDPEVTAAIQRGIARMSVVLEGHMRAAGEQGLLPADVDPRRASLLLMAVAWGGHVLIEAGVDADDARGAAEVLFGLARSSR